MSRINRNIHSTAITPTLSIPFHFPPAACFQLVTCLKECSVCLALTPQLAVLPRCPLGQRWQMFWWWPAGTGSFISTSSATWKRLFSFSVFTEFFGLLPWTSFEQRSWQRVQLWHLFNRGLWPRESYSTVKWSCVRGFEWVSCTATCSRDRSPCCCSFNVLRRYRWWELTCFECQCLWIFRISIESSEIYF